MTLTIEELKYGAAIGDLGIDAVRAVCAEALANREAQPVGYIAEVSGNRVGVLRGLPMPDVGSLIYTAPPAPAVPDEISSAIRHLKDTLVACNRFNYCADAVNRVENACRAAMLAQPVSSGYTLNSPEIPDGWKLVPIDATRAMIDAAQMVEEDGYDAMYKAMLAAALESGNGA